MKRNTTVRKIIAVTFSVLLLIGCCIPNALAASVLQESQAKYYESLIAK